MPRKRREMKGNRKPNPLQKSHGFIILKWFFSHHQQETILCLILEKISKNYKIRPQHNHPRTQNTCRILNYSLFPTNPTHTLCLVRKRLDRKINKTRNFESLSNIFFSILFFLNEKKQKKHPYPEPNLHPYLVPNKSDRKINQAHNFEVFSSTQNNTQKTPTVALSSITHSSPQPQLIPRLVPEKPRRKINKTHNPEPFPNTQYFNSNPMIIYLKSFHSKIKLGSKPQ